MDHDHFLAGSLDDHFFWPLSPEPFHDLINAVSEAAVPPPAPAGPPPPTVWRSAFSAYTRPPPQEEQQQRGRQNVHRRLMELLRWVHRGKQEGRACGGGGGGGGPGGGGREFRHMMRERQRRERLSQSYADLHYVLSPRTKADKNSVVQSAATMLRDLKGVKERLQRRNEELVSSIRPVAGATPPERAPAGDKTDRFEVRVESQDSSIDSMISALRCLQGTGVKTKAIQLKIAGGGGLIVVVTTERDERNSASKVKGMLEKMLTVK
ncbi:Transcription factor bHLH92 [Apostasia shenzhenica]|uniref:Transcription factor bHLH92 n=1 Tax=Apostasia shenzhenica TaxID=1088818 RepID=A0A2H9ZV28_9ASPA|nr:Transcription factor bHLH92 [Apostasia shenzhenica]